MSGPGAADDASPSRAAVPGWAATGARYPVLAALCLVLFLPGFFTLPPVDRDEARFAQAARQMLETGDFVNISFQDRPRNKKPAGIYWLQAASAAAFGGPQAPIWAYRLPSLVGATGAVLLTAWVGSSLFGPAAGLFAALALAGCLLLGVEARMAKTDAMLLLTVVLAQGCLARAYLAGRQGATVGLGTAVLFWLALGLGVLLKGPIILLAVGATAAAVAASERRAGWLRQLRPAIGVPILLAVVLPWLIAVGIATGGRFFADAVGHDLMGKVMTGQESHGAPPGYYLASLWLTFWPFSLAAGLAAPWAWARRRTPEVRFCLAWIVPTWLVFELVPTKLPHYVLPVLPAVALLAATAALEGYAGASARARRWAWYVSVALVSLVSLGLALALLAAPWVAGDGSWTAAVAAALAVAATAGLGIHWLRRARPRAAFAALFCGALGVYALGFQALLPSLDAIWLSPRIAEAARRATGCERPAVAAVGYTEPSLVFLLGTGTVLGDVAAAARHLRDHPGCAVAVIPERDRAAFEDAAARDGVAARRLAALAGIDYTHGRRLRLQLYGAGRSQ